VDASNPGQSNLSLLQTLGDLRCYYQPVVALRSGHLVGVEALVRLLDVSGSLLTPDRFLPQAEANGSIVAIDGWVLQTACRHLSVWLERGLVGRDFTVSVNLSARSLASPFLPQRVVDTLAIWRLPPNHLQVELSERTLVTEDGMVRRTLKQLRALGVQVALDAFGTGDSSLTALERFQFDVVKLDRTLIKQVAAGTPASAVAKTAIGMAKVLGIGVMAVGIETDAQAEILTDLGCRLAQGFLFSRPLPGELMEQLLSKLPTDVVPPPLRAEEPPAGGLNPWTMYASMLPFLPPAWPRTLR
jgi:EAL domain-containing protein (putative c-di-GMP-specific phosphodiesterase class I)